MARACKGGDQGGIMGQAATRLGRRRLAALGLALILAWALLVQGGSWLAGQHIKATIPQGENILRLAVSGLRGELAHHERLPDLLARAPVLSNALDADAAPAEVAAANLYLRHVTRLMGLSDAYVMDAEGMTVAASNFDRDLSFVG